MSADEKKEAKEYLVDVMELDEGVDFASDMTKSSAEKLMNQEMKELKNDISNTYTLTEDNTGDNKHIVVDPEFAQGVKITLTKANSWEKNADGVWPDTLEEIASDYSKAYTTGVTNKYKKATIKVVKVDKYSDDKKAHGDADLDGAQFQLYADSTCQNKATVYDSTGNAKTAGIYTVKNGELETDFLRSNTTYYLKEAKAPKGYTLSNDVLPIYVDCTEVTAEYTYDLAVKEYGNTPILGKVAIQKYFSEGQTGLLNYEGNTTFQVYLTSKKSYDACDKYERATIKTDSNGYAITPNLYYGEYTVHQVDTGDVDAIAVDDFQVEVTENGKIYTFPLDDIIFKAYLRILKKDGNTEKQVLKPGTTYQIYRVTEDGEKLVEQTYSDGNTKKTINQFITDETGEVMTVKELKSGTYRIYETDSATGLHITTNYIEVTINSKADNYESFTDEDGYTHAIVTVTYTNAETFGKLKLYKTGEMLTGYEDGNFIYENRFLKGAEFEVYAAEDIVTQDNQGTNWYDKGELVTTITTGEGAEFEKECKDITGYSVDEDGTVTVQLPLGKYHVKEKNTMYGYVLPDNGWEVEFNWNNKDEEYVLNATDTTDENGVLRVENARANTEVSLFKRDAVSKQAIAGAEFGIFTKHDIFNVDGEKIVDAGTMLGTVTTNAEGKAASNIDLPLMSEGYETTTGSSVSVSGIAANTAEPEPANLPESDVVTESALTLNMLQLDVPKANYRVVTVKPSGTQKEMVAKLAERAERVRNGMVDATVDNMLLITNDGRKLALDQRLINELLPDEEESKVNACVKEIVTFWQQGKDQKLTQLVFSDLSTPKTDGSFNVYDDLRKKLVEKGIPQEEVAFIHEASTDTKKKELFAKVRSGAVRVLIGSTFKMGAGTNVQDLLIASHDLDCPWRPRDLEQRRGRSIRQGNKNKEVDIIRYVTEGTFDAYLYQVIENKQKFISQIMTSKSPARSVEDVDMTALSYAEIKALASGNPAIKEKMDLDVTVSKLQLLKQSFLSQKYELEGKILNYYPKEIKDMERRISCYEKDMELVQQNTPMLRDTFPAMEIHGKIYEEKSEAGKALIEACKSMTAPDEISIGRYRGLQMGLFFNSFGKEYVLTLKGSQNYQVTLGTDIHGNITRIDNAIAGFSDKRENCKEKLEEIKTQYENAKKEVDKPFSREEELREKSARLKELDALLDMDKKDSALVAEETSETISEERRKFRIMER